VDEIELYWRLLSLPSFRGTKKNVILTLEADVFDKMART
jgi:hypothetical protein